MIQNIFKRIFGIFLVNVNRALINKAGLADTKIL